MTTTPELFISDADPAASAADQDVKLESASKPSQIASHIPRDLRFGALVRHCRQKKGLTRNSPERWDT